MRKKSKAGGRDVVPGFGPAVKRRREELGYSLREAAGAAGTSAPNLSHIERETRSVSLRLALAICRALDIDYIATAGGQLVPRSADTPSTRAKQDAAPAFRCGRRGKPD